MLDYARALDVGVATFASVGNKADVSGNDLLSYWAADERTRVIALYLESFGNPRHFARIAPRVARQKPVVALKAGRGLRGGGIDAGDRAADALFSQASSAPRRCASCSTSCACWRRSRCHRGRGWR
jgi:acyl-CoA synthetase (NDP forming)